MRIPTKKSSKKIPIIIASIAILLSTTAIGAYYLKFGPFATKSNDAINLSPATQEQKTAGSNIKQSTLNQSETGKESTGSDPAPKPQPVEGSDKMSVGMEISAMNQTDSTMQIRAFIQTVTSTGTCVLAMKNTQGLTYTARVDVQALSSSTTCKGFDIPLDQLTKGNWTVNLNFSNDTLIASSSKEITVK